MTTTDWKKLESTYYMQVVNRMPLVLVKGQGTIVWDESGKKYLDFTSGWAVMNLGHTHPAVSNAIKYQVDNIMQMTNLFYTIPQLKLAKLLIDNSCFDRVTRLPAILLLYHRHEYEDADLTHKMVFDCCCGRTTP